MLLGYFYALLIENAQNVHKDGLNQPMSTNILLFRLFVFIEVEKHYRIRSVSGVFEFAIVV
jgi:hypothetical protein